MGTIIIGLIGKRFAGKDEVAEYLVKSKGANHIKYSDVLDEILEVLNLPISRRNEIDLGLGLRKTFGDDALWGGMQKRMKDAWSAVVVINGIRFQNEFLHIKELGGKIIYITSPEDKLFLRSKIRKEKADDGELDKQDFQNLETELTEVDIPKLGEKADYIIENIGNLEDLYKKVEEIYKKIIV